MSTTEIQAIFQRAINGEESGNETGEHGFGACAFHRRRLHAADYSSSHKG
ncbi:hypothetical protein [Roseiflexus sp.]